MVTERDDKLPAVAKIAHGLRFGLGERFGAAVGSAVRIRAGALVVVSPFVSVITIQINTVEVAGVFPPVLPPLPAAVRVGLLVVHVTVRIDDRDEVQFAMIH